VDLQPLRAPPIPTLQHGDPLNPVQEQVKHTRQRDQGNPTGRQVSQESPPIEKTIVHMPEGLRFAPKS